MNERELIVVKYGSSSVVRGDRDIQQNIDENIGWFTYQLSKLHAEYDLVVVTSGSVAVGRAMWPDLDEYDPTEVEQFLAMSGNPYVMTSWIDNFQKKGVKAGELLLTHKEIEDDKKPDDPGSELRAAMKRAFAMGAVPIVNENDALSLRELAELHYGGDNDGLAAHIARSMGARALFLMTETNGVQNVRGKGYGRIRSVSPSKLSWNAARDQAGSANAKGRGGMKSKVEAAISAAQAGIDGYIAHAQKSSFASIQSGKFGTHFYPVKQNIVE